MALNGIARMVRRQAKINPADKFLNEFIRTIQNSQDEYISSKAYKPSSMGGCIRALFYEVTGVPEDGTPTDYNLQGICESGTSRHETLQEYVMKMKECGFDCEWIDVGEYIKEFKPAGTTVIKKMGTETKCFNSFYNMRFLCDGIIKFDGKYYVLEIKTESCYKYDKHDDAYHEHKIQGTCYSLCFEIDDVIFLYENRDNCFKKTFLVHVDDEMKDSVEDKIAECDIAIEEGRVPAKEKTTKNCQYCDYRRQCRKDS